jgi:hypothetical protein
MDDSFFKRPILNSPYASPARHWELDADGQPTNRIIESRRRCDLITPVPKPQRRRRGRCWNLDAPGGVNKEANPELCCASCLSLRRAPATRINIAL